MKERIIPFIEERKEIDRSLSKLFNIVVNYHKLNNPRDVGMCTEIYSKYFKNSKDITFNDAKDYYLNSKPNLRNIIKKNQGKMIVEILNLFKVLDLYLDKDSKQFKDVSKILLLGPISRDNQYKNILYKVISIFHREHDEISDVYNRVLDWYDELKKYDSISLKFQSSEYLMNLLTIESMIGTSIENDILYFLKNDYGFDIFKSDFDHEQKDIDAFINGNYASIKSVKYKFSSYKRTAARSIEDVLEGAPIIYYRINQDTYVIDNLNDVINFYKKNKNKNKNLDILFFNKIKHLKI